MATTKITEINPEQPLPFDPNAYLEERIPVYLMWDGDKYKDDVFLAVNGENCLIKRGETVMVKRKFADVLAQSADADVNTRKMIKNYETEYSATVKRA